ncbi:hypothetical protein [Saccharothrix sp. Mg75]|uniref:hypothetical protein n=1 Tax=Saccharothrix sp. Mg75 TaxID=3445357 RepID=UPI003EF02430
MGTWWRAYRRKGRDGLATRTGRPGPAELVNVLPFGRYLGSTWWQAAVPSWKPGEPHVWWLITSSAWVAGVSNQQVGGLHLDVLAQPHGDDAEPGHARLDGRTPGAVPAGGHGAVVDLAHTHPAHGPLPLGAAPHPARQIVHGPLRLRRVSGAVASGGVIDRLGPGLWHSSEHRFGCLRVVPSPRSRTRRHGRRWRGARGLGFAQPGRQRLQRLPPRRERAEHGLEGVLGIEAVLDAHGCPLVGQVVACRTAQRLQQAGVGIGPQLLGVPHRRHRLVRLALDHAQPGSATHCATSTAGAADRRPPARPAEYSRRVSAHSACATQLTGGCVHDDLDEHRGDGLCRPTVTATTMRSPLRRP